jgi:hypothetical protein
MSSLYTTPPRMPSQTEPPKKKLKELGCNNINTVNNNKEVQEAVKKLDF